MPNAPSHRDHVSIALLSCAVLVLQITLTRVLSVVVWYHWAFLTISVAMLGMGAPGVWLWFDKNPLRRLPACLLLAGVTTPAAVVLIVKFGTRFMSHSIVFIVLCILPPMLFLGAGICLLLIKASGPTIGSMYGSDLLGACLGAALVIPAMHFVATPQIAAATGLLPLIALWVQRGRFSRLGLVLAVLGAGLVLWNEPLSVTRSKQLDERKWTPIYEKWTPTARLAFFDDSFYLMAENREGFTWGRGSEFPEGRRIRQYWIEQDGGAGTPITEFDGNLSRVDHLLYDVTTVGYQLRSPRSVAIVGAGGGRDILSAMLTGADEIDAIELNRQIVEAVSGRFKELSGDIYHAPGVHAIVAEGRSFLSHTDRKYDLIQISLIDTWAASSAGAFTFAENNLYTLEALELYDSRLTERGLLSTSRWVHELPRLLILTREYLDQGGIPDPAAHLAVVGVERMATVLMSKRPFDKSEIRALVEICSKRGFELLHPPRGSITNNHRLVAAALEPGAPAFQREGYDFSPPRDDSPFFFHTLSPFKWWDRASLSRTELKISWEATLVLQKAMITVIALAVALFFVPFARRLGRSRALEPSAGLWQGTVFFASIGSGFMLLETSLLQRFVLYLGHPSYAMTVTLSCVLLGLGVGSFGAPRLGVARMRGVAVGAAAAIVVLTLILPGVFEQTLGMPLAMRVLTSCLILLPLGTILGLFFPLGMIRFGDRHKPWFWAINGVFGVAASVLSLALAMEFGFAVVGYVSAMLYAVAWLSFQGRPAGESRARVATDPKAAEAATA